jgi:hypothetical protein
MILETLSPLGEPLGNPKNITGLDWSDLNINESNHLGCVRCTIAVGFNEISPTLSQQLHINLPSKPGRVVVANGRHLIWLSPRSWLILFSLNKVELDNSCLNEYSLNESSLNESSLDKEKKLLESINAAFPDRSVLASTSRRFYFAGTRRYSGGACETDIDSRYSGGHLSNFNY